MKNITNQSPKAASQDIKNIIGIIMVVALCVGNLKAQVTTIYPNSDTLISTGVLNKSNASNLFMTEVAGAEVPKAKFKKGKSVSMNGNIAISGTILGGQKVLLPGGKSAILREQQMDVTKRPTKMLLQGEQSLTTITNENFIFKDSIEVFNNNLNAINTLINSSNAGLVKMGYIRPGQSVKLINGQTAKISDTRLDFTKPFSIVTLSETQSLKSISNQNLNFNAGLIVLNTVGVLKGKIGYNQNVKMINGQMIIPVENFEVQFEPNGIREAILALDQNFTCPNTQILNFKSNSLLKINENNDLIGTLSASQNCKTIDNQNYLFTGTITCSSLGLVKGTVSAPQQVKAKHGEMVSLKDELLFDNIGCIKGKLGITSSLKTQFDKTLVFKANTSIEFTSLGVSKGTILFTTPSYQNALKSEAGYMVIPISSNEYFFGTTGVISGVFELYEVGNSNLYLGHPNTSVEIPYGGGQLKSRSSYPSNHMYLEFSKTNLSGVEFKINRTLNNSIINNVICSSITRFDANNKIIFTNLPNPQIFTTPVGQSFNFKNEIAKYLLQRPQLQQAHFTSPLSSTTNTLHLHLQLSDEENDNEVHVSRKRKREYKLAVVKELRFDGLNHLPKFIQAKKASRCKNEECEQKTRWYCIKCNVHLCLTPQRNCFNDYHING